MPNTGSQVCLHKFTFVRVVTCFAVYLIWIGLASFVFQEMSKRCEQTGITKLAEMYGEVSRLFKVASQCEELHARHFDENAEAATQAGENSFMGVTVKYDTMDKMAVDGDVAEGSSGQRVGRFALFLS